MAEQKEEPKKATSRDLWKECARKAKLQFKDIPGDTGPVQIKDEAGNTFVVSRETFEKDFIAK